MEDQTNSGHMAEPMFANALMSCGSRDMNDPMTPAQRSS